MKTSIITSAFIGIVMVLTIASCTTARSYPESRRYPERYPTERIIVVREHRPAFNHYRKPYSRRPYYARPYGSQPQYRKEYRPRHKQLPGGYKNQNYYKGKTERRSRN